VTVETSDTRPAARLRLARLAVARFRNHVETVLPLDGRHVCLHGANGAGKTNLLEALSMLAPGRGMRGADLSDLACRSSEETPGRMWALSLDVVDGGVDRRLLMAMERDEAGRGKRVVRLDGAPVTQTDVADMFRVLWLTPSMDRVFAGAAGDRRKFLDRMVLAHAPAHGTASAAYEKAMRQRNALLEEMRPDPSWLDGLEQRMAEAGAAIALHRANALTRMQAAIDTRPDGEFPKADLTLDGDAELAVGRGATLEDLEDRIFRQLREARRRDAAAGRAIEGVHRTDLKVVHRPKGLSADLCSTGEQKALLMGLVLSNARALQMGDMTPNPLLLLDEAAAHLDSHRRAALYDELAALNGQAWLTGTDRSLFDAFGDRAQRFVVADGSVCED
jgi:DNA replication and repair protein RecF